MPEIGARADLASEEQPATQILSESICARKQGNPHVGVVLYKGRGGVWHIIQMLLHNTSRCMC